ncbi:hypothetical protein [Oceanicola sp. D3]|uniref:hypothetical protein n=1 Tax=Oceanicola sp. D3 TaxID=2587163 RepID=UPI00143E0A49|nr:hypothetical protein [Oceanicola sp. D3]
MTLLALLLSLVLTVFAALHVRWALGGRIACAVNRLAGLVFAALGAGFLILTYGALT